MDSPPERSSDERALVERARDGDRSAFQELYKRHAEDVLRFAIMPMVRNRALGEELLADTFVRALENIGRFEWRGRGVLPWLIRIGKNRCLDHLRRAGRVGAWPEGYEHKLPETAEEMDAEWAISRSETADVLRVRISVCLDKLNPRYRRVVQLRLIEKVSRDVAAAQIGVTIGTLDVLLFRACRAFRRVYLAQYGRAAPEIDPEFPAP